MHRERTVRGQLIEYWEIGPDQVQHFSWVTDLRVNKRNVYTLMRGGRARWENWKMKTFNTLKTRATTLSTTMAMASSNLFRGVCHDHDARVLADQTQQLCCALFRAVCGPNWVYA